MSRNLPGHGQEIVHVGESAPGDTRNWPIRSWWPCSSRPWPRAWCWGQGSFNSFDGRSHRRWAGPCGAPEVRAPTVLEGNFDPGFMIRLHLKDLRLALEAGHALGVPLPVTAIVREMYNALQVAGKGDRDHSAIILLLEEISPRFKSG